MKMTTRKSGSNKYCVAFAALVVIALQFFVGAPVKAFEVLVTGAEPPDPGAERVYRCDTDAGDCEPHIVGIGGIPHAIVNGPDGSIYVGQFLDGVVKSYTADGEEKETLPVLPGRLRVLEFGPKGVLYAAVEDPADGNKGSVYSYKEKKNLWVEVVSKGLGGLETPGGLAFGPDKKLYVASATNQILRYKLKKDNVEIFVDAGEPVDLNGPLGIRFVQDRLVIASANNDVVVSVDSATGEDPAVVACNRNEPDGPCVDANEFTEPGPVLNRPTGLTLGPGNHVFVSAGGTNGGDNVVLEYDQTGAIVNAFSGVTDVGYIANLAPPAAGCIAYNGAPPPPGTVATVGKETVDVDEEGCFEVPVDDPTNISIKIGPG